MNGCAENLASRPAVSVATDRVADTITVNLLKMAARCGIIWRMNRPINTNWTEGYMKVEEYGKGNAKTIVMLHGAHLIHTFNRQYALSESYHIVVPHIMGFGDHTDRIFQTDECVKELADYIKSLNKKVMLVGFSLGAQLAFRLVAEYEELFESAIIVSPWLLKEEPLLSEIARMNSRQLRQLKNKCFCGFLGMMNGLPPKVCKAFVAQMQNVQEETVHNIVYNGITIDSVPKFADVKIPVIALAGAKEQDVVHKSVRRMAQINPNCRCEIWDKAAHNIPPLYAKRFNALICAVSEANLNLAE